jgi:hypothetical protein
MRNREHSVGGGFTAEQWDIHFYRIYQDLRDDYAEWEAAVFAEELTVCEIGLRPADGAAS